MGKSNSCRRLAPEPLQRMAFVRKRLHKIDFVGKHLRGIEFSSKTAGSFFANRLCVDVFAWNVDKDRVSSKKPQVRFREFKSVSIFGLETSTETEFRQQTSTQNWFLRQSRRRLRRKSNLCRGFRVKRRHKSDFPPKPLASFWEIGSVSKFQRKNVNKVWILPKNISGKGILPVALGTVAAWDFGRRS